MSPTSDSAQPPESFPLALAALQYAGQMHAGQRREADGAPFMLHLLEVSGLLYRADAPDHVIAAGTLHDIVEKTDASADELAARFGWPVARLVLAVSEDERIIRYDERKAALREQVARAGDEALMIFAADKISKVRDLRRETAAARRHHPGRDGTSPEPRLAHYRQCLQLLEELLADSPLVTKLRGELDKPDMTNSRSPLPRAPLPDEGP